MADDREADASAAAAWPALTDDMVREDVRRLVDAPPSAFPPGSAFEGDRQPHDDVADAAAALKAASRAAAAAEERVRRLRAELDAVARTGGK